jgi:uncharacterized UPF0146 family protein
MKEKGKGFKIDLEEFERKAKKILEEVVKPQVERYEEAKANGELRPTPPFESEHFLKADTVDGQWLSPVKSERAWQEEKLVEIFSHYPRACPKWQYMNGLIDMALRYIELTREEDDD